MTLGQRERGEGEPAAGAPTWLGLAVVAVSFKRTRVYAPPACREKVAR